MSANNITTEPTAPSAEAMTPAQLAEAKEYGHRQLIYTLLDKVLDVAVLAIMALLVAKPFDAWLMAAGVENVWLRLACIYLGTLGVHEIVSFPLSFFAGYLLEHRYGLSRQSLGRWLLRHFQRLGLLAVFTLLLVCGLFGVIWATGPWWWAVAAALFFVVSIVVGQLVPVLIVPLFYKVERLDDAELAGRMNRLSQGTGLSIEGVYRLGLSAETVKANAMLAGLGRTRRVLMGDTLLAGFTPDEIEVIFAHEIGHHVFGHIWKMILIGGAYSLAGFWLASQVLAAWTGPSYDPRELPPSALPLLMLVLTLFALLLEPLQNALSRRFERQCDRYALERTGLRTAYRAAFEKLARLNKDDPDPHPLEVAWFHSHPPIRERLAIADEG
jgi:STE24 endopeptidase